MKAILFDFDYTLADSSEGILDCLSYALQSEHLPVPDKTRLLSTIGLPLADTFRQLAPGGDVDGLIRRFIERADQVMVEKSRIYDTVSRMIPALQKAGYKTGIVSTKYRRRIIQILSREGLGGAFDVIVGGEDVSCPKPHPEGIHSALRQLGCLAGDSFMVGDSAADGGAANASGVRFIGVLTGVTPREALWSFRPVAVIDNLDELAAVLREVSGAA